MRYVFVILSVLVFAGTSYATGIDRIDVSAAALVNMAEGHSGRAMGGSITADLLTQQGIGLRTTIGYSRSRYYPSDLDYSGADHGLWLSLAPYGEVGVGERLRPYLALLGTFTAGTADRYSSPPIGMQQAPVARLQSTYGPSSTVYSLGVSVGSKLKLTGPVSVFVDLSHYFFTSISGSDVYFGTDEYFLGQKFDFEHNPTFLSVGLTWSIPLASGPN